MPLNVLCGHDLSFSCIQSQSAEGSPECLEISSLQPGTLGTQNDLIRKEKIIIAHMTNWTEDMLNLQQNIVYSRQSQNNEY